jgi:hypothetical protein
MNRLIGGVLIVSGLFTLKSAFSKGSHEFESFNAEFESYLLKAEIIGEELGEGVFGRTFTLPDGNVLKIVNLDSEQPWVNKSNRAQANFVRDYLMKTRSGEWKESPFLPKIYHYNEGTASPKMVSLMKQEGVSKKNPLDNQQVAFWVMEKIPYIAEESSKWKEGRVNPSDILGKYATWEEHLRGGLEKWLKEQGMDSLEPDDIHEGNYGFREPSMDSFPVYFDMSFDSPLNSPYKSQM